MIFRVKRTSHWTYSKEATDEMIKDNDYPGCKRVKNPNPDSFYTSGGDDYYFEIEINSLEELMSFIDSVGINIILAKESIEIYDDYRE